MSPNPRALADRRYHLKKAYGLTPEAYDAIWLWQGKRCAICHRGKKAKEKSFPVDHNHQTGAVRGILCPGCNRNYLGRAPLSEGRRGSKHAIEVLHRTIKYLGG